MSFGTLISTGAPIEICNALAPITRAFSNLECSRIFDLPRYKEIRFFASNPTIKDFLSSFVKE
ncbi:uncharacterized protein METZ01_LOCUS256656 [marine metagenome]|uniref:Uncharacterized protein n=1 Tax=marine metagenome TaxID=408172 RepID=A0A382IXB4_9ZZZZ